MTITFENDNDVIVYALEKVIAYARRTQQIFVAHCVWWLASNIGLEQGLVNYISNRQARQEVNILPEKTSDSKGSISPVPRDIQEGKRQDIIVKECEEYLKDSRRLREIAALKATGRTLTGLIIPTPISKKYIRKKDRTERNQNKYYLETEGIESTEIKRRKEAGECLRCAWPTGRKGFHRVVDCRRPIKLDRGTASFPTTRKNQTLNKSQQQPTVEEDSCNSISSKESCDDSL
jgi:hypothetical protein